jgi:uracil-DNA glycosylase family 4
VNKRLRLAVRNAACSACRMSSQAEGDEICVTGQGPNNARVVIVTKFPVGPKSKAELVKYLEEGGWDTEDVMWCSAIKCRTWDMDPTKTDLKSCRPYLQAELDFIKPEYVLCIGGEALFAATGKAGIMKYRGKLFTINLAGHDESTTVMATIAPGMVARNPGYREGFVADLRYFNALTQGLSTERDPYHLPGDARRTVVGSKDALRSLVAALNGAGVVSYDVETTRAAEHEPAAAIVSLSLTTAVDDMSTAHVWEIPLFHPQSPWRRIWQRILEVIGRALCRVKRRVAHNAKFDTRWLRQFGMPELTPTFDTIIATALLDENRVKALKPLAQQILGADPWGIDTTNLLATPLDEVLEYNGLDTWHTLRLYFVFRQHLKAQPRIGRLFVHLMMPLVQELVGVERAGVYVDREVLATNHHIARTQLADVRNRLMEHVPPRDQWPANIKEVNFNASNFARWFLFDHLELPILGRGKKKDDGSPGMPSMAEAIMLELAELHPVGKLMGEHALWFKRCSGFFEPYEQIIDANSRIHTTFKPWGTVTGRLSSGKEDAEKLTAQRDVKGVNLQQVPRDQLLRGVFGAPPGSSFVEADYSQIELRIAAFMAREETMLHLYATGQDIHMATAMRMTGKPASAVTKEERKRAKAVNFGFLYGMGWLKFIATAWENYQLRVTEAESKAFRTSFFDQFPKLPPWHNRQRRLAHKYGRVSTPMGRVRNLPDIYSPMQEVQAEAERQAINSPVQAMASDMAALSLVHVSREFRRRGLRAHPIGTVHDAVNFEIPNEELREALPIIKDTMETLPLERLFGVVLDVPIVADIKVGTHWGGARELSIEEIYDWQAA